MEEETQELVDNLMESIREQQTEFDECPHNDIVKVEEDLHWECNSCGLHFEPKSMDSSRLPDIKQQGNVTSITHKEFHPDWVRREAVLKRMRQIFDENIDEEGYYRECWNQLRSELKDMMSDTDLLKLGEEQ